MTPAATPTLISTFRQLLLHAWAESEEPFAIRPTAASVAEIIERVVWEVEDVAKDVEEVDITEGDVAEADVEEAAEEDAEEDTEEDPKEDAEEDSEEGVEKKDEEEVWVAKFWPFIWIAL